MTKQQKATQIATLIEERKGYVARGLDARVAEVDAQLRHLGHEAQKPAQRAIKRTYPSAKIDDGAPVEATE